MPWIFHADNHWVKTISENWFSACERGRCYESDLSLPFDPLSHEWQGSARYPRMGALSHSRCCYPRTELLPDRSRLWPRRGTRGGQNRGRSAPLIACFSPQAGSPYRPQGRTGFSFAWVTAEERRAQSRKLRNIHAVSSCAWRRSVRKSVVPASPASSRISTAFRTTRAAASWSSRRAAIA